MIRSNSAAQRPRLRHALVPTCVALMILGLHALPGEDIAHASWLDALHVDKLIHLGLFALLTHSAFVGLGKSGYLRQRALLISGLFILYGAGLEWMQGAWFSGRHADILDAFADAMGVVCAWVSFGFIYKKGPKDF